MDFALTDEQRGIVEAVAALCVKHAGPARAIDLAARDDYDFALEAALANAGFSAVVLAEGGGVLEAVLVVESAARAGAVAAVAAATLVVPATAGRALAGPVALADAGRPGLVRFGAHARTLLVCDGDAARVVPLEAGEAAAVRSSFGYPMGRIASGGPALGESLGAGSGPRMRNVWRLALAAETVGTMSAALDVTVEYVKQRRQFGRAIGSFQAVQHRLAECAVLVEGARWLTYEAAWKDAPAEAAALAAAHATAAAGRLFEETHQLSGAIGYTREHDLHVFSMRLQALRLELTDVAGHRRAVAEARWLAR